MAKDVLSRTARRARGALRVSSRPNAEPLQKENLRPYLTEGPRLVHRVLIRDKNPSVEAQRPGFTSESRDLIQQGAVASLGRIRSHFVTLAFKNAFLDLGHMPGKKHLTRNDIQTYLNQNPVGTDEEMARHFGVKAERIRAIRRRNGIPLAIGSTALKSAVSEPRSRVGETPDSRATDQIFPTAWQELPTIFPQPPNPLNQVIMSHYRRLAPVMGVEYTQYGPVGLIPYFISEMKKLNGRIKTQDEEITRLSSTIQSLQGSELHRRVTQQEQALRHASNELGQARRELFRLRKEHEVLSQSHTHQSAHLSTMERELSFAKQQYTALRHRNSKLQSSISESQSELKDAQRRSREEGALEQDRRYRLLFTDHEISARVLRRQAMDERTDQTTRMSKLAHATILEMITSAREATIAETQEKLAKLALRGANNAPEKLLR